jgi:hypothetical protein
MKIIFFYFVFQHLGFIAFWQLAPYLAEIPAFLGRRRRDVTAQEKGSRDVIMRHPNESLRFFEASQFEDGKRFYAIGAVDTED